MRQIGSLHSQQHAERFSDFLATQGVSSQVEENDGHWCIWVRDEDQLDLSRAELDRFRETPDADQYVSATSTARQIRLEEQRRLERVARNSVDVRQNWNAPLTRRAPLTAALIAICVAVGLFSDSVLAPNDPAKFQANRVYRILALFDPIHLMDRSWNGNTFADVEGGQVWRLFTPAFLHLGFTHIIFNMFVLHFFGSRIESRQHWPRIAILFFVGSAAGVLGESLYSNASVVGFSGVGYAMFGYLWAYGMIAPEKRLGVEPINVMLFMGWLVAGFIGILDRMFGMSVGNVAHLAGMLSGFAVAAVAVWYDRRPKKPRANMTS